MLAENQSLEKLLHKLQLQQNLISTSNRVCCTPPGIPSSSSQNISSSLLHHQFIIFNSPKLLKQLDNPLSPLANTPEEKVCKDSPEFISVIQSSTPKQLAPVSDDSISVEKVSVLHSNRLKKSENNVAQPSATSVVESTERSGEQQNLLERNNTSEEDYWKVNISQILEKQSPHDSLHAEISEVTIV